MQIPTEMRRRPPRAALAWAAAQIAPNARVCRTRRLRNAWASAVHAVDVDDGAHVHQLVLRRWVRTDLPPDNGVVENESAALALLADARFDIPVPRLIGKDVTGAHADVPAVLMSRVPGRDVLAPRDIDPYLDGLATTLRAVHAVSVPDATVAAYRPWGLDTVIAPPSWSPRADVWTRAIDIAHRPLPVEDPVLLHRDFHPGNVLWRRGEISGLVDWTHACRGPAAADVAHCRMNLAVLFGIDVADEFARRYGPVDDLATYDIAAVVGAAADGPPEVWRWHDAGRIDVTDAHLQRAHDELLARAISGIS
jgi:aminoglycoside phosphotransferase (APT) family kinase protein